MADRCIKVGKKREKWPSICRPVRINCLTDPEKRGAEKGDRLVFHAVGTDVKVTIHNADLVLAPGQPSELGIKRGSCLAVLIDPDLDSFDNPYTYSVDRGYKGEVKGNTCGDYQCNEDYATRGAGKKKRTDPSMVFIES